MFANIIATVQAFFAARKQSATVSNFMFIYKMLENFYTTS